MTINEIFEDLEKDFEKSLDIKLNEAKHTQASEYLRHWEEFPKDEKHYSKTGKRKYGKWVYDHKENAGIGESDNMVVHHKNGDKHDNRKSNLQICSRAEHCKIDPNARKFTDCMISGCENKHYSHHLCLKHYMQKYRSHKFGSYDKSKNYSKSTRKADKN